MSVPAQIIVALDSEAVRYFANTTCSIKGALLPRKMFPDFPLGGAENGAQCVNLCSAVEAIGRTCWSKSAFPEILNIVIFRQI